MHSIAARRVESAWAGLGGLRSPRNRKNRGHRVNQLNNLRRQESAVSTMGGLRAALGDSFWRLSSIDSLG